MPGTTHDNKGEDRCNQAIATGCTAIEEGRVSWKVKLALLTWFTGSLVATIVTYTSPAMTQAGGNQAGVPLPADITVGAILGPLSCVLSAISLCIIETGPCS